MKTTALWVHLVTLCCLLPCSSSLGWCQEQSNATNRAQQSNRQGDQSNKQESAGDKQGARSSGNSQSAAQETDKKPTTAPFTVTLKNGTTYQVSKTEELRNGNVRVTLTDGSVITIAKKDLAKIVNNSQPAEAAETRTPPGQKPGNNNPTPPKRDSSNRNSPPASSDRPRKIEEQSAIQPQPSLSPTLTLSNGRKVVAQSAKQLDNRRWQVMEPNGNLLTLDPTKVSNIRSVNGSILKPQIGPNGEITWLPETGNAPDSTTKPTAPGVATVMFDTLSAEAVELDKSSSHLRQEFIASGDYLESVEIRVASSPALRARVFPVSKNAGSLGEVEVSNTPAGVTSFVFSPAIPLVIGDRYRVEFAIPQPGPSNPVIKAQMTERDVYVFSGMQKRSGNDWVANDDHTANYDLAMRIKGKRPSSNPAASPTQRALLVLLENDGIVSSLNAAAIGYPDLLPVPFMVYTCENGEEIRFKLQKNESIAQALVRLNQGIAAKVTAQLGPAPQPPKVAGFPNPTDPNYINALNQYNQQVQELLASMTNSANWEIQTESAEDFIDTVSDFVIEQFTSTAIYAKTSSKYNTVVILEDAQFGATNVLAKIQELAPNYELDIHVLSHGGNNVINGADTAQSPNLTRENFFVPLQQGRLKGTIPLRIRAVYQCNCRGGSLKQEWLALGAQAVCGTKGEEPAETRNNYMPQQYHFFLDYWCNQNLTFQQANNQAFTDSESWSTGVYSALSEKPDLIEDSRIIVSGNGNIKRN